MKDGQIRVDQGEFLKRVTKWLKENEWSNVEPLLQDFKLLITQINNLDDTELGDPKV